MPGPRLPAVAGPDNTDSQKVVRHRQATLLSDLNTTHWWSSNLRNNSTFPLKRSAWREKEREKGRGDKICNREKQKRQETMEMGRP